MSPRKVHVLRPYPDGRTFCGRDPRKVKTAPPGWPTCGRCLRLLGGAAALTAAAADGLAARDWPESPD